MSQITLRQIPEPLEIQLRILAKENKTSLNKIILKLLMNTLGITDNSDKKRDLKNLFGTWGKNELEEFEMNTKEFNQIDPELWK